MSMLTRYGAKLTPIVLSLAVAGCSGSGTPFDTTVQQIFFETQALPPGGAGQLFNEVIRFGSSGGAALPDRFELGKGVLPPGVTLIRDRADNNADGLPDVDGAFNGHARLLGFPRQRGDYSFRIKAISTGLLGSELAQTGAEQPDLSVTLDFALTIGEGSVAILSPTAAEGTSDPAVPAFPEVIDFVNPANPQAFFSFAFLIAGGSGSNILNVYLPRELELSTFDAALSGGKQPVNHDSDEVAGSGDKLAADFDDGGLFVQQAGDGKVQVGGFQSPRGPVPTIDQHGDPVSPTPGLDPAWFQKSPLGGGPAVSSRRTLGVNDYPLGDDSLGTVLPVQFSDYFDALYEGTHPDFVDPPGGPVLTRRKYPFQAGQYVNAFQLPPNSLTGLRYRIIVEAIDTKGTPTKGDDVISRKAYIVQVRIPDIVIDTVVMADGQAGVDYTEFFNASGGVPPLSYAIEWVDGTIEGDVTVSGSTAGDPLTKQLFGLDIDKSTGRTFGLPRASGTVDLTFRVSAAVMNPKQSSATYVWSRNDREFNGTNPRTGLAGIHKTIAVMFGLPSLPFIANSSLKPGVDGQAYPGDRLVGGGGVANLVPYPVDFVGTYPSAQAARTYAWTSSYIRDASHGAGEGTVDPARVLPHALALDGNLLSPSNGSITGTTFDRGFHPCSFVQTDVYVGDAAAPSVALNAQVATTTLGLSVSPDAAAYLRGVQTSETAGGTPSGLLDATAQMAEARMVPLFLSGSLYSVNTGEAPRRLSGIPLNVDLLPVMLPNGGSDAHNNKGIPSISGTRPAESNKETRWYYIGTEAWKHSQQEVQWLQAPNKSHARVFLWGETTLRSFSNGTWTQKYQQHSTTGKRGVLVAHPLTGEVWSVAVLTNSDPDQGTQFGAEVVMATASTSSTGSTPGYDNPGYWKYYYYAVRDTAHDREVLVQGLGSYIDDYGTSANSSNAWYKQTQGRSAISVAMSADGLWCATALPGGNEQRILLWRTDKKPIPGAILAKSYVVGVPGEDAAGVVDNLSCIINLGGEDASGTTIASHQRYLYPDSLMFVRDGLLFLNETQVDRVFGISLIDGSLSSKSIAVASRLTLNGAGTGPVPFSFATVGQYPPDQDYLRGQNGSQGFAVQFSFAGSEPAPGTTGPAKVAFVAGDMRNFGVLTDLGSQPRDGYTVMSNRDMSLLFLELAAGPGFDLSAARLTDLTGSDADIYGDLLTPGRIGEEHDWLAVSPDGRYVAVVRDFQGGASFERSVGTFGYISSFHTGISSTSTSSESWQGNDDLLLISTTGADMDSGTNGEQHVLFVGSKSLTVNGGDPAGMPGYATGKGYLNARHRRINGVTFSADSRSLFFNYASHNTYHTKYTGGSNGWAINPTTTGTFGFGTQTSIRLDFRAGDGSAVNFASIGSNMVNSLSGLGGVGAIGPTSAPFGDTSSSAQMFWATFKSPNGKFLYFISDELTGRNHMVGIRITSGDVSGSSRAAFTPFSTHPSTIGFEQFDANAFGYENRFAASPGRVVYPPSGRDGDGILFVIASASSAGATSATDLEVYAMDTNIGSDLRVLTAAVTGGTANAINHLYASADGNYVAGQRSRTTGNSRDSRATLNGDSDLFVVTNVHAVVTSNATPEAVVVSASASHGSTVAFVGEGTATGPQALVFSSAAKGTNTTWDDRTLKLALLDGGSSPTTLDGTASHYVVLAAGRRLDDSLAD